MMIPFSGVFEQELSLVADDDKEAFIKDAGASRYVECGQPHPNTLTLTHLLTLLYMCTLLLTLLFTRTLLLTLFSCTNKPTNSFFYSLTCPLFHSITYTLFHSFTCTLLLNLSLFLLTHSLIHSLTPFIPLISTYNHCLLLSTISPPISSSLSHNSPLSSHPLLSISQLPSLLLSLSAIFLSLFLYISQLPSLLPSPPLYLTIPLSPLSSYLPISPLSSLPYTAASPRL